MCRDSRWLRVTGFFCASRRAIPCLTWKPHENSWRRCIRARWLILIPNANPGKHFTGGWMLAAVGLLLLCAGCRLDMHVQPRYNPYDPTDFFGDGQSARLPVAGTVPRGELTLGPQELLFTGKVSGQPSEVFPFPVTQEVVERGRERYNVFCSPCHGYAGDGDGMIVQRGFKRPPSFHEDHMKTSPV